MKKFISIAIAVVLLGSLAYAQSIGYIKSAGGNHDAVYQKMYCPTEGDYVFNTLGTAKDTSAVYKLIGTRSWNQVWAWSKPDPKGADSLEYVLNFDVKSVANFNSGAGNNGLGWLNIDSMLISLADSLGGRTKELDIPAGTYQVRMRQDGTGDSDSTTDITNEIWLIFKD